MSIEKQVRETTKEVIRLQDAANKAVVSMENALKELVARVEDLEASLANTDGTIQNLEDDLGHRVSVLEDSVTTIEECPIEEWNTPAKEEKEDKEE